MKQIAFSLFLFFSPGPGLRPPSRALAAERWASKSKRETSVCARVCARVCMCVCQNRFDANLSEAGRCELPRRGRRAAAGSPFHTYIITGVHHRTLTNSLSYLLMFSSATLEASSSSCLDLEPRCNKVRGPCFATSVGCLPLLDTAF